MILKHVLEYIGMECLIIMMTYRYSIAEV